nr:hypothetical protein [Curtobacterium sp. MCPF17_011]
MSPVTGVATAVVIELVPVVVAAAKATAAAGAGSATPTTAHTVAATTTVRARTCGAVTAVAREPVGRGVGTGAHGGHHGEPGEHDDAGGQCDEGHGPVLRGPDDREPDERDTQVPDPDDRGPRDGGRVRLRVGVALGDEVAVGVHVLEPVQAQHPGVVWVREEQHLTRSDVVGRDRLAHDDVTGQEGGLHGARHHGGGVPSECERSDAPEHDADERGDDATSGEHDREPEP